MRRLTDMISEGFIWGVGITRPGKGRERLAAAYITFILAFTIAFVLAMFLFLKGRIS